MRLALRAEEPTSHGERVFDHRMRVLKLFVQYREFGGAEEDRTPDLLRARQALSQLSYGPLSSLTPVRLVGLGGFEPPTSPLSGVRSNLLSYRPAAISKSPWISQSREKGDQCVSSLPTTVLSLV